MSLRKCPSCSGKAEVTDSRPMKRYVRRRYACKCGYKYTTAEFVVDDRGEQIAKCEAFMDAPKEAVRQEVRSLLEKILRGEIAQL